MSKLTDRYDLDAVLHENFAKNIKENFEKKKALGMLDYSDVYFINFMTKEFVKYKDDEDQRYVNYVKSQLKKAVELPPVYQKKDPEIEVVRQEI